MRTPVRSRQFRRDVKRAQKRGKDMKKLRELLVLLLAGESLPERCKDHPLKGPWKGYRDAHIEPDWLLIYPATSCTWCVLVPTPICSRIGPVGAWWSREVYR